MYHMAMECAYGSCFKSIFTLPDEMNRCLIVLYVQIVVYLILALYLYQVVPQTYGVHKHPLFFLKKYRKTNPLVRILFSYLKKEKEAPESNNMDEEDVDSKQERVEVHKLKPSTYPNHPLVVKDMRKVYPGYGGRRPKVANHSICLKVNKGEILDC